MNLSRTPALALTTLTLLLGGCGALTDDSEPSSSQQKTKTPRQDQTATDPAPTATSDSAEPEPSGEPVTVPAYFVSETPQGLRLYREFRQVDGADPMLAAAALLTAGKTLDPDYRSFLPAIEFTSITAESDLIVATVADDQWSQRPAGMSASDASLAVQQLIYTLQGVAQERLPLLVTTGAGDNVPLLGVPTQNPTRNRPPLKVLALVSVTTPEEGAVVGDTFTATGIASSFEANVPWQIWQDGQVVDHGFATAEGWMDKLYPWSTDIDVSNLAPGAYQFIASTDDPSDGEGGGPTEDTKTFIIE